MHTIRTHVGCSCVHLVDGMCAPITMCVHLADGMCAPIIMCVHLADGMCMNDACLCVHLWVC